MIGKMSRRSLIGALGAALVIGTRPAAARDQTPGLAITIDDFNLADTPLLSGVARDHAIRSALRPYGIKAAGFVAGRYIDGEKSRNVLAAWSDQGHLLGNHTFSHDLYDGNDPAGEMADILKCEALLSPYASFGKLFRFPYLAEGKTAQGRDALRVLLREHGYRNAPVTIDTSDWYIDQRLVARLKSNPKADVAGYKAYWLQHIWDRATYYDGLAKAVLGHSINHTILLHHRLTTGLFLSDGLEMFKKKGWQLVNAADAFSAPEMKVEYETLPAGQSLMWAAAKASGRFSDELRYPAEDDIYEKPKMDALGL